MKVFISWSGDYAKSVALMLRDYLPRIIQALEPWMSDADLQSGQRWQNEIGVQLEAADIGICVVTPDNMKSPWLNFEAGAISKAIRKSRPIPLLCGLKIQDLSGPLTQFQAREDSEEGFLTLMSDLSVLLAERPITPANLKLTFKHFWPAMKDELRAAREKSQVEQPPEPARSSEEMLAEILGIVRGQNTTRVLPGGVAPIIAPEVEGSLSGLSERADAVVIPGQTSGSKESSAIVPQEKRTETSRRAGRGKERRGK